MFYWVLAVSLLQEKHLFKVGVSSLKQLILELGYFHMLFLHQLYLAHGITKKPQPALELQR